jgi:hypothetical protein
MATTGAANMRTLARQTAKIPDEAVAELVRWFVPRSEQVGGRMRWYGKNIQLSSRVLKRRKGHSENTVLLGGTPPAGWSIKSYGRHTGDHGSTQGDKRWDKLIVQTDAKFVDVVARLVDRRVRF